MQHAIGGVISHRGVVIQVNPNGGPVVKEQSREGPSSATILRSAVDDVAILSLAVRLVS